MKPREWWLKHCDYIPDRAVESYEMAKCTAGCAHIPTHVIEHSAYLELQAQCEKLAEALEHFKELRLFADRGGGYYGCYCKEELEELLNYDENFNKKNWIEDAIADYNKFKEQSK